MIAKPGKFFLGLIMLLSFFVVLVLMFLPIWGSGKNMLDRTDDLFNTVSKSSSNFQAEAKEEAEKEVGTQVSFESAGENADQAQRIARLYEEAGATATAREKKVEVSGDLGNIMVLAAEDSELAFENKGGELESRYGYPVKNVMYDWFIGLDSAQKDLTSQGGFDLSKAIMELNERAVEPAYNYYGIEASSPGSEAPFIMLALAFYIIYTVWYGFSLLFMFEGWGLKLEH